MGCFCKVRSSRRQGGGGQSARGGLQIYIYLFPEVDCGRFGPSQALAPSQSDRGPAAALCVTRVRIVAGHFAGMDPSSTSMTPFSVKDILNLEHQNNFANEFVMASQDAPVHYQPGDRGHYDAQPEPLFVSGIPEKLEAQISATEEEINEQGEI